MGYNFNGDYDYPPNIDLESELEEPEPEPEPKISLENGLLEFLVIGLTGKDLHQQNRLRNENCEHLANGKNLKGY
jgi:hypothetical protein